MKTLNLPSLFLTMLSTCLSPRRPGKLKKQNRNIARVRQATCHIRHECQSKPKENRFQWVRQLLYVNQHEQPA
ncbi:MAG: hypothetical protein Q8Q40_14600 [Methylococcaceae bacterium]|nr:hypothetical protein [Methylococcaceae bacterium]MDP3905188.1 hypothetical protein [Methylococcaceae bacterium]